MTRRTHLRVFNQRNSKKNHRI